MFDESRPPDWQKLRALSDRAEELESKGDLTQPLFDEIWNEAVIACNGHTEFLEALILFKPGA